MDGDSIRAAEVALAKQCADRIGALYGGHRATVARWTAAVRDTLVARTREILMDKIAVDRAEFDSIMRLIQSQLDVSLSRLLREGGAPNR